ncbi:outer membrane lipoprotein-sorting protein [Desulfococcaceae bacterium HSG9]|nr:outer membrane lipoprotein-sorting protein [Desulfococcaceae bacterium HSG9]
MWLRLILIMAVFCGIPFPGVAEELTGNSIIEEMRKRHTVDNELNEIAMTLIDRNGQEIRQSIRIHFSKNDGENTSRYLTSVQYLSPANIRGVELLTHGQKKGKPDEQWMYLPADRSFKQISGNSTIRQFIGPDIAFEDIRLDNLDGHEFKLIGEDFLFGRKAWKIATNSVCNGDWDAPSDADVGKINPVSTTYGLKEKADDSPYGKLIIWVDQVHYYPLKIEFYSPNPNVRHVKTVLFEDIRQIKGPLHRSFKITWKRIRQNTSTVLLCRKIEVDVPNKDTAFSRN